jgi:hypothetical protein
MGQPIQLFDSAGHRAGTLFEHRSARVAEIGLVLPQAVLDPGGVRKVAGAESEGVGRTRGPLLGGAKIFLRRGSCRAKNATPQRYRDVWFSKSVGSLLSLILGFVPSGLRKAGFQRLPRHKS